MYEYEGRWNVVADAGEVHAGLPLVVRRFGSSIVLWRGPDGTVHGERDACSHREQALSVDTLDQVCLDCLEDSARPAVQVRQAHGWIWMWRGPSTATPPAIAYFGTADSGVPHQTTQSVYSNGERPTGGKAGRTRMLANLQLEVVDEQSDRISAHVPIDDDHTVVYVRTHRQPALARGLAWVSTAVAGLRTRWSLDRSAALGRRRAAASASMSDVRS
ncbi:MAG: Rieske (2Fe-2S) protein [Deltaproteobacteria bacterium]|nr:Rieske (2Fe-2S) protein [Deltaproteobacteria bacterium]